MLQTAALEKYYLAAFIPPPEYFLHHPEGIHHSKSNKKRLILLQEKPLYLSIDPCGGYLFQVGQKIVLFILVDHLDLIAVITGFRIFDADDDFYEVLTRTDIGGTLGHPCVF